MATDPKKDEEIRDENLEDAAGGLNRPRLDTPEESDDAGNKPGSMKL